MKIKKIEKMVKDERALVIRKAAGGDVWIGTGICMYNVGNMGSEPGVTVRWLFGLTEMEADQLDGDDHGFEIPTEDLYALPEDDVIGIVIADSKGNAVEPHVFGGIVYMLADGEVAPMSDEKGLSYKFDPETSRIIVYRGMFPVASIHTQKATASVPYVGIVSDMMEKIKKQSALPV